MSLNKIILIICALILLALVGILHNTATLEERAAIATQESVIKQSAEYPRGTPSKKTQYSTFRAPNFSNRKK